MRTASLLAGLGAAVLLAACAEKPARIPAPVAPPLAPTPVASESAAPPAVAREWSDLPLSPGDWRYLEADGAAEARFEGSDGDFSLRCDRAARRLSLSRQAGGGGTMTVRTSAGMRSFAGSDAQVSASDGFLDAMVFSRGRITVEAAGAPMLVIPTWPEPARVVEECRG